ncbi:MAG: hypothetical protein IPN42_11525 [Methylococcaceae bacterium]|nr:hypothetical protein [Methylococcaceae bacterium]
MIDKNITIRRSQFCQTAILIFCYSFLLKAYSCEMPNVSIAYFKPFSVQTYLPIEKKDFEGYKVVIKNKYFKELLDKAKTNKGFEFFENIRMTVAFENKFYYLNEQAEIELNKTSIGKLDKETRNRLDLGYGLYEWKTCRPLNEVMAEMLEKHNKHVDELMKKSGTIIYRGTNKN